MITNDSQLNKHQEFLKLLDDKINFLSNEILKISDLNVYIQQVETIEVLREKRLGCHFLILAYNSTKQNNSAKDYIIIQDQTSLVDLSNAYYGSPDYYQHIYDENNLTSLVLTAGQKIFLPDLPSDIEINLWDNYIFRGEVVTLAYEDLGII